MPDTLHAIQSFAPELAAAKARANEVEAAQKAIRKELAEYTHKIDTPKPHLKGLEHVYNIDSLDDEALQEVDRVAYGNTFPMLHALTFATQREHLEHIRTGGGKCSCYGGYNCKAYIIKELPNTWRLPFWPCG